MPVCSEVVPPEVRFADGVRVACHLYPTSDATPVPAGTRPATATPAAAAAATGRDSCRDAGRRERRQRSPPAVGPVT